MYRISVQILQIYSTIETVYKYCKYIVHCTVHYRLQCTSTVNLFYNRKQCTNTACIETCIFNSPFHEYPVSILGVQIPFATLFPFRIEQEIGYFAQERFFHRTFTVHNTQKITICSFKSYFQVYCIYCVQVLSLIVQYTCVLYNIQYIWYRTPNSFSLQLYNIKKTFLFTVQRSQEKT